MFSLSRIFVIFSIFWSPRDGPGPHFGGFLGAWGRILVVWEGAGNAMKYCYPGWLAGGGPKILPPLRLEARMKHLAPVPAVQQIAGLGQQD